MTSIATTDFLTDAAPTVSGFAAFELLEPIKRAVACEGYTTPTPIQAQCIPHILARRDLLGCAQTGTGKTAAFALPMLDRFARAPRRPGSLGPRALILTPTRELAVQIGDSFSTYGRHLRVTGSVIFGGVSQGPQVQSLRRGIDVLVATPGRLIDLMEQGHVRFDALEVLVLDEADRMLDMGFIQPIRRILAALPRKRQTILFSATMPQAIGELAAGILVDPIKVAVTPVATTAETVAQSVLFVPRDRKRELLRSLLQNPAMRRVLVFTRTKHGANRVAEQLDDAGVNAEAIHGNKSQNARQRALDGFKAGRVRVLVATDIAARGIDIDGVSHVINFELPNEPESYVHRIGRTGRAGAAGIALSFCDGDERGMLRDIERLTRIKITVDENHPFAAAGATATPGPVADRPRRSFGGNRPRHGGGGRPGGDRGRGQSAGVWRG